VAFCEGQGETIAPIQRTSGLQTSKKYFRDRIQAAQDESTFETGDQILTNPSQTHWNFKIPAALAKTPGKWKQAN
jgi:hypothetical protein